MKILLTVDDETQRRRILDRPEFLHKRFFEEWIPMENRYFDTLIREMKKKVLFFFTNSTDTTSNI